MHHVADKFDLRRDVTTGARVATATWDDTTAHWDVTCEDGTTARGRYLVMATGCLSAVKRPHIEGARGLRRAGAAHRRLAARARRPGRPNGSASSAPAPRGIQVIPRIAPEVEELVVLQRHPRLQRARPPPGALRRRPGRAQAVPARAPGDAAQLPTGLSVPVTRRGALDDDDAARREHYEQQWQSAGFGFLLAYNDLLISHEANATAADFIRGKIASG